MWIAALIFGLLFLLGSPVSSPLRIIAMKNAFLVMPDFIVAAGWGLVLLVPLMIAIRILAWLVEKDQVRQTDGDTRDLADIRAQLGLAPFKESKVGAR